MKRTAYYITSLIILLGAFAACTKGDNYYYDYKNKTQTFDGTILQYIEAQPTVFDSLVLVLDRLPALRQTLGDESKNLTLFAVTNRSFEIAISAMNNARALTGKKPMYLEDLNQADLDSLTSRYVLPKIYDTEFLAPFDEGQTVESIGFNYKMHMLYVVTAASGLVNGGQQQIAFSDVNNSIFQRYWKTINTSAVNLQTKNGVIHTLSSGHDFGFNKLTNKFSQTDED